MGPNCDTPWTLAREPEGPLADHLDTFARRLHEQGFKRRVIGVHVRTAARFSRWLQAEHVAAADLTDEHARCFLEKLEYRERVRLGVAATLRRLIEVLRRLGVCCSPTAISEPTPIERIVAAFANHLGKDQGLSTRTLVQYCPVAKSFLSERFGTGPVDLATLRGLDVINFVQRQAARVSPARAKAVTIRGIG